MGLGLGIKGWVQYGREATWATGAVATHRIGYMENSIEAKPQFARSANMPAGNLTLAQAQPWMRDPSNAGIEVVGEYAEGQLVLPLDYDGPLQWYDMIMGCATFGTYGASVAGTGPYTHSYGPEKEVLNAATLQLYENGVLASNVAQVLGAKLKGLGINVKAGAGDAGVGRLTLDIIAQQKKMNQAPTAAITPIARLPIYFSHMTAFDDGLTDTATDRLREVDIQIKPEIAGPEWQLGSAFIREPVRDGLILATMKIVREYVSDTAIVKYKAGSTAQPSVTFASGGKSLQVLFNSAKIVSAPQPKPGLKGILLQEITYECLWDPIAGGVAITAISTQNGAAA